MTPMETLDVTDEFRRAMTFMETADTHVFITGRAGTGKSTLLRHFMETTKRRVVVLAPTGLAAVNVGGQTIHSFFKFPPRLLHAKDVRDLPQSRHLFEQLETVIIDEISMVRADVLDAIDRSLRLNRHRPEEPFGGVQLIAFGDLLQLAPVVEEGLREYFSETYETPYFFSANVLRECEWSHIELGQNHRQRDDPAFFRLLSRLGYNDLSEDDFETLNARCLDQTDGPSGRVVTLTSTHVLADEFNARHLDALDGEETAYHAHVTGEFDESSSPASADLVLKKNAQVMILRNDPDHRWVNGDIGLADYCDGTQLRVRVGERVHTLEQVKWERIRYAYNVEDNQIKREVMGEFKQFPVKLAWAMTIHKSQGQTFEKVVVDLGRGAFAHGQTYVALSRCQSLEGLWLRRPLRPMDIRFDDRVLNFVRRR